MKPRIDFVCRPDALRFSAYGRAKPLLAALLLSLSLPLSTALAASAVQGRLLSDGVTGRPTVPGKGWTDGKIWIVPLVNNGLVSGVGGGGNGFFNPPGWYSIAPPGGFPGGTYGQFTHAFDSPIGFSYRADLVLPSGSGVVDPVNFRSEAHYSVMYDAHYNEWGSEPWIWGDNFYQTFVATSSRVTRIGTKLAGKSGDHFALNLNFALYQVNDGPPSTWTQISRTKSWFAGGNVDPIIHVFWVGFRSNEFSLVPGQTYAVRFWVGPGSQSTSFALVARPNSPNGYANGQLYSGNTPLPNLDAYAYVSGGTNGTIVNHTPIDDVQFGDLIGSANRHGQTFTATGTGVAAVDVQYATGDPNPPSLPFTFRIYESINAQGNGVNPLAPAKTVYGISGNFHGRAACFWAPGEVNTTPNHTYYIEWTTSGVNMFGSRENLPGDAYVNGVKQSGKDMLMAVAEYAGPPPNAPDAEFTATPTVGIVPLTVSFLDQSTGQLSQWSWDFGTGATSNFSSPVYTYTTPGTYTVSLTVGGPGGLNTETKTGYIVVKKNLGDFDLDGDTDQQDFGRLQSCLTGPGLPISGQDCLYADMDRDGDVDQSDFLLFAGCLSGANVATNPTCRP